MSKDVNSLGDNLDKKPETPNLSEDFEMWLKGRKEQQEFLVAKSHLETHSKLTDLREDILEHAGVEKKTGTSLAKNVDISSVGGTGNKNGDFSALSSYFNTRKASDIGKSGFHALPDSLMVIGGAGRDIVVDFAKLLFSPRRQIANTVNNFDDTYLV